MNFEILAYVIMGCFVGLMGWCAYMGWQQKWPEDEVEEEWYDEEGFIIKPEDMKAEDFDNFMEHRHDLGGSD